MNKTQNILNEQNLPKHSTFISSSFIIPHINLRIALRQKKNLQNYHRLRGLSQIAKSQTHTNL